jgi:hypothetical protein
MASWFPQNVTRAQVCRRTPPLPPDENVIVTRTFVYSATATTTAYPDDTIPFATFEGIDQLVIEGTIPAPNTVIYMPPATALLDLFKNPEVDDQYAIDVSNHGGNSVDLTIYKANAYGTGQAGVAYTEPFRQATIPAYGVVRLYLRVINATPTTGIADVKLLTTLEGGTGSLPLPVILYDMATVRPPLVPTTIQNARLITQQIVPSVIGPAYNIVFGTAAGACFVLMPAVPDITLGPIQLLYPTSPGTNPTAPYMADTSAPPLVGPFVLNDAFTFSLIATNRTGYSVTWTLPTITGVTYTGPAFDRGTSTVSTELGAPIQLNGVTYKIDFKFSIQGVSTTSPPFQTSTLAVVFTTLENLNPFSNTINFGYGAIATRTAALTPASLGYLVSTPVTTQTMVTGAILTLPTAVYTIPRDGFYMASYAMNVPTTGTTGTITHSVGLGTVGAPAPIGVTLQQEYTGGGVAQSGFANSWMFTAVAGQQVAVMATNTASVIANVSGALNVVRIS